MLSSGVMSLALLALIFVLAGLVKGVLGMGMPTVLLALLTVTLGLPDAMALMLVPTVITNVWQALVGGQLLSLCRRLWGFLLMACVGVWPGVWVLSRVDARWLSLLLGGLLILYAALNLSGRQLRFRGSHTQAGWLGACNGLLTGLTGSSVFPGVPFLQSIGLPRDALVQAMGLLFSLSTLSLALALGERELLSVDQLQASCLALLPAGLGMWLGAELRRRLSEARFRQVFLMGLLAMGGYLVIRSLLGG
ncbi:MULTISPECIES: sulfite exporter TauE/SafE family protein [unclassified Halomonas]|uniref:sulfite exporter TauE/SafE family protein n=1 Tax=Halomonas TaxID=2745 RepID=UPI0021BC174E|nr:MULTISPECIES: sulfite exporter TauE/SafE family protein [unclassified Halomonas]